MSQDLKSNSNYLPLISQIEILLLAAGRPLSVNRLEDLLEEDGLDKTKIEESIQELNCLLESNKRPYRVHKVAGGWRFETLPEYAFLVQRLYAQREEKGLSPASMETLSVIAYRQPLMRAEIEAIRGVGCGEVLRSLLDKRLVKISGRAEAPGRPMLYGTGPEFLHLFGLSSLEDLPEVAGLSIKK